MGVPYFLTASLRKLISLNKNELIDTLSAPYSSAFSISSRFWKPPQKVTGIFDINFFLLKTSKLNLFS